MLNKYEDAIKVYSKALQINEKSPECHFNLASAYNDMSNYSNAVFHYKRAIELDPKNIDAYICLGGVLENVRDPQEAEKVYLIAKQVELSNPRIKEALSNLRRKW